MEAEILLWIQENIRQEWLTPVVKCITYLGNAGAVWIALALLFLLWLPIGRRGQQRLRQCFFLFFSIIFY